MSGILSLFKQVLPVKRQLCSVCTRINFQHVQTEPYKEETLSVLGSFDDIQLRDYCVLCTFILRLLAQDPAVVRSCSSTVGSSPVCTLSYDLPRIISVRLAGEVRSRIGVKEDKDGLFKKLFIVTALVDVSIGLHLRPIPNWKPVSKKLDSQLIRRWLNDCETSHSHCRSADSTSNDDVDIMLIDVVKNRLIQKRSNCRYLALSYVWGDVQMLKTTKENFPLLTQSGALSLRKDQIPQVIRDTMKLVLAIGEKYLWVDTLCIVQDDPVDKHAQIAQMHTIYHQSALTIVAFSGETANSRLPGVQSGSRFPTQSIQLSGGWNLMSLSPEIPDIMRISTYERRAWTLQERLLSRRCLYLTHWHAYFQCQENLKCEGWEGPIARNVSHHRALNPLSDLRKFLSAQSQGRRTLVWKEAFDIYVKLVHTYTRRQLSYPSDILNAFCGLSTVMEQLCRGPFTCGLPKAILDLALLWAPSGPRNPNASDYPQRREKFPTWSWAGWAGPVSYNWIGPVKYGWVGQVGYFEGLLSTTHEFWPDWFVPAVRWVRIQTEFECEQVEGQVDEQISLDEVEAAWPQTLNWQPTERQPELDGLNVLQFWAFSASATKFSLESQPFCPEGSAQPTTNIFDVQGRHCGVLLDYVGSRVTDRQGHICELLLLSRIFRKDFSVEAPTADVGENEEGGDENERENEVLALLRGSCDWSQFGFTRDQMDLLNVMLTQRQGDYVERVAVGRMHRAAWEQAEPDWKYIKLA